MIRSFIILLCLFPVVCAPASYARVCEICPVAAEDSLVNLINDFRGSNGVAPMVPDRRLIVSARRHAADLVRNDFLSFTGTDGSTPESRRVDAGYPGGGEANVIVNSAGAEATFSLLQLSPEAISNFLNPAFRHIGVGRQLDASGEATSAWSIDYGSGVDLPFTDFVCFSSYCPLSLPDSLLALINAERADSGLVALLYDDRLASSAHQQACEMTTYSRFTDSSLLGASSDGRMLLARYQYPAGTLIANAIDDADLVFGQWLADPQAAAIMLNPAARHLGIGWAGSGIGPVPHAWAVDFGISTEMARPIDCACCVGDRGNVDGDAGDEITLTDLTVLVNALFVTFEALVCVDEANVNADPDGLISLSDLTVLVNHLFITFEPMPPCP